MIYFLYIVILLIAFGLGYTLGYIKNDSIEIYTDKPKEPIVLKEPDVKILKKMEPTSYDEKRNTAIKEGKDIIKTFHK